MPDWEKIEFTRKSIKRKETFNEFGKKVRFEPLKSIPKFKRNYQSKHSRETLIWKENDSIVEKTNEFVRLALNKGFSEEQALHVVNFNNFNYRLSECDLSIYQPLIGMRHELSHDVIDKIADKIRSRISSRQNRDLNLILMEFPAYTMGSLLDFYGNNRIAIKRKTVKYKSKYRRWSGKEKINQYLSQINPALCGDNLYRYFLNKNVSTNKVDLSEVLDLKPENLDKYLLKSSKKCDFSIDHNETDIVKALTGSQPDVEDHKDSDVATRLDSLLHQLDDIEQWMRPGQEQQSTIRHKWDHLDISLLLLGLHEFGTDFEMLADAISTKTKEMVEAFYHMFKDRYQLDKIVIQTNLRDSI